MWGKVNKNSRNADGLNPFLSLASKFYMAIGGIAPRITREIFFLVQNTLDCYGKFFFSCETPLIVTGNFFLVQNTLDCYGKFFFSCERPSIVTGNFFSRANDPRLHKKRGHFCRRNTPLKQIKKMRFYFIVMHRSRTAR